MGWWKVKTADFITDLLSDHVIFFFSYLGEMLLNRPPFDLDFSIVLSLTGGEGGRGSGSMCMNTEVARMLRSL